MIWLKEGTQVVVKLGPFIDDTDGKTAETGLTLANTDVRLSKNGGNFAASAEVNAGYTHDELGYYDVTLTSTDLTTLGSLIACVHQAGSLPIRQEFMIVASETYDALVSGPTNYLPVNVINIEGSDATDQINAACDTAFTDYDPPTKAELDSAFTEIKGATWSATDTLEAIRDRGDAAWVTATGFSTHSAADVWSVAVRVLTANTNLNDPTAAAIADAVWDEASTGHTDAGKAGAQLWTDIDAILVDTGTDGVLISSGTGSGQLSISSGVVAANAAQISGDATAADNLEAMLDGTGSVTLTADITGDITGNLSGSVGSVTGAVGSVTGAVGSVTGAVGSVTAEVTADVTKISGSATAADNLERGALGMVLSSVNDAAATTTSFVTNLSEATNDHYKGRIITFVDGDLAGQSSDITAYNGTTKAITVTAMTDAPANGNSFVIT